MSNKYDPILGEYRQADTTDISGLVPYTGATGNVDLGSNDLALTGTLDIGDVTTGALIVGDIGGDARGVGSIDIQQSRTVSTQVASGQDSIAFGRNNSAISRNAIAIGEDNSVNAATLAYGFTEKGVSIGSSNSINGTAYYADTTPILIGISNTATATASYEPFSATLIGKSNTSSSPSSVVIGTNNTSDSNSTVNIGISNIITAIAAGGVVLGRFSYVNGAAAFAMGVLARAIKNSSVAIGTSVRSLAASALAIGASITNWNASSTMIGNSTSYMFLDSIGLSFNGNEKPNEKIHSTGNVLATNIATLGAEKITNGTFTGSATGWTVGSFAYSANTITKTANGTTALTQTSAAMVTPLVIGETYLLSFSFNPITAGSITVSCAGVTIATITASDPVANPSYTFSYIFKATSTANLAFTPTNDCRVAALDTVSLKKITGGDLIGLGSLYLGQDDTNRMQISVGATGAVTLNANGAAAEFIFSDSVRFNGSTKSSDGSAGFTGTGAYTNFTIKDGLITAAS